MSALRLIRKQAELWEFHAVAILQKRAGCWSGTRLRSNHKRLGGLPLVVVEELVIVRPGDRRARGTRFPNRKLCNGPTSGEAPSLPHSAWQTESTPELKPRERRLYNPAAKDCRARREQEISPECI